MTADAWQEYLAAAQRLDAVRHGAVSAAGEQAAGIQAAHEQLTALRARLAPQRVRLRELGAPEVDLTPSPPEMAVATRAAAKGPVAVLAMLRQAGSSADAADAVLADRRGPLAAVGPSGWPGWARRLLMASPLVLVLLVALACAGLVILLALI